MGQQAAVSLATSKGPILFISPSLVNLSPWPISGGSNCVPCSRGPLPRIIMSGVGGKDRAEEGGRGLGVMNIMWFRCDVITLNRLQGAYQGNMVGKEVGFYAVFIGIDDKLCIKLFSYLHTIKTLGHFKSTMLLSLQ